MAIERRREDEIQAWRASRLDPSALEERLLIPWQLPRDFLGFWLGTERFFEKASRAQLEASRQAYDLLCEDLTERGLLGEHELVSRITPQRGSWLREEEERKSTEFLFYKHSEFRSKTEAWTGSTIEFAWSPGNRGSIISEVPVHNLTIMHDPAILIPRIFFVFRWSEFVRNSERASLVLMGTSTRYIELSRFPHVNDYLRGNRLAGSVLIINPSTIEGLPVQLLTAQELRELPKQIA